MIHEGLDLRDSIADVVGGRLGGAGKDRMAGAMGNALK